VKREGDGCAPAGVFTFGKAFSQKTVRLGVPCATITPTIEGVDDPDSRFYNRLVDRAKIEHPDWKTSEKFFASPHYSLGIWVNHNPAAKKGSGSCIYIHEWVGDRTGTAGCTVLRRADLDRLMHFLNQKASPALVQLPKAEAKALFPELSL
jgi:D-alanyl-D-alanine dipeptidase